MQRIIIICLLTHSLAIIGMICFFLLRGEEWGRCKQLTNTGWNFMVINIYVCLFMCVYIVHCCLVLFLLLSGGSTWRVGWEESWSHPDWLGWAGRLVCPFLRVSGGLFLSLSLIQKGHSSRPVCYVPLSFPFTWILLLVSGGFLLCWQISLSIGTYGDTWTLVTRRVEWLYLLGYLGGKHGWLDRNSACCKLLPT